MTERRTIKNAHLPESWIGIATTGCGSVVFSRLRECAERRPEPEIGYDAEIQRCDPESWLVVAIIPHNDMVKP